MPSPAPAAPPVVSVPLPPKRVGDSWLSNSNQKHTIVSLNPLVTVMRDADIPEKAHGFVWELDGSKLLGEGESSGSLVERLPRTSSVVLVTYRPRGLPNQPGTLSVWRDYGGTLNGMGPNIPYASNLTAKITELETAGYEILSQETVTIRVD